MAFKLRPAAEPDAGPIEALVTAAYEKYVAIIGRKPKPMLANYRRALLQHQFWVYERESLLDIPVQMV